MILLNRARSLISNVEQLYRVGETIFSFAYAPPIPVALLEWSPLSCVHPYLDTRTLNMNPFLIVDYKQQWKTNVLRN